jgi:hypothetical protein
MRISIRTKAIFDQINREHFGLHEFVSDPEDLEILLVQIEESGDIYAIPGLLNFLLKLDKTKALLIAETIHNLLGQIPVANLPKFEEQLRTVYLFPGFPDSRPLDWYKVSPQQVPSVMEFGEFASSLLGVFCFHNNGYVREAATIALDFIKDGSEIPFLLLRANDWVHIIRKIAYQALLDRCMLEYTEHFTKNLPLVMRLTSCDRSDHTYLIKMIVSQLEIEDSWKFLLASIQSEEMAERRDAFFLAIRSTNTKLRNQAIELGIRNQDTLIRVWSAKRVNLIRNTAQFERALSVLREDSFMPVRLAAIRHSVEHSKDNAVDILKIALLDRHISIREFARFHLNKLEPMDYREYYRAILSEDHQYRLYAAIGGLGETGIAADDVLLLPFVKHRLVKIRTAALRALAKSNLNEHTKTFIACLEDESPKVSREAARSLLQSRNFVTYQEQIWLLINKDLASHVKLNAFSLISKLSKWDSIFYLLKLSRLDDEMIHERTQVAMRAWWSSYNRTFTQPNQYQKKRIREELANHPSKGISTPLDRILQSFD